MKIHNSLPNRDLRSRVLLLRVSVADAIPLRSRLSFSNGIQQKRFV